MSQVVQPIPPNFLRWRSYVLRLRWEHGNLDHATWSAALRGAALGIPPQLIFDTVVQRIRQAGDSVKHSKVADQIARACAYIHRTNESTTGSALLHSAPTGATAKICFNPQMLAGVAMEHRQVVGSDPENFLKARSPIPPDSLTPAEVLDHLYVVGEHVVIFTDHQSQGQALWTARGVTVPGIPIWGPAGVWFLVQPVTGEFVPNPRRGGSLSRRSEEAVTAWRYAVLESDEANPRDWMTMLAALPMPIAAIYTSGGRSIHALVRVDASSKRSWDEMIRAVKPRLVELGADPDALTAVRLSRLPQAWRGPRQQRLLFLNPAADSTPIMAFPISTPNNI